MGIKTFKPTSPARRYYSVSDFKEITKDSPERALTEHQTRTGGRNNNGRITSRFRGGGHKQRYRIIDFKRDKIGVPAQVAAIEYDPNRTARIALLHYADGEKRYILAPDGLGVGDDARRQPFRRHQAGQQLDAALRPARHDDPQRGAQEGQGRAARSLGRRRGAADGQRRRLRAGSFAERRNPQGARRLPRHHRPGIERRSRQPELGQSGSFALARSNRRLSSTTAYCVTMNPVDPSPMGGGERPYVGMDESSVLAVGPLLDIQGQEDS